MATEPATSRQPDWAVIPGALLAEALEERSMSQAELALDDGSLTLGPLYLYVSLLITGRRRHAGMR